MDFEESYIQFMDHHTNSRHGERKGRLLRGHNYAEKLFLINVWWPLFGSLQDLHPEYEVYDWNRRTCYLDFAFLPGFGRFGLECDGFQSHVREMNREKFSYALNRDTFLTGMGWKMVHFSFDDIQDRPEVCRSLLQHVISPSLLRSNQPGPHHLPLLEKEIIRLAWMKGQPITPKNITDHLQIDFRTARRLLRNLVDKTLLHPLGSGNVIRRYELSSAAREYLL